MKQNFNAILESINKKEALIANDRNKNDTRDLIVLKDFPIAPKYIYQEDVFLSKIQKGHKSYK